MEHILENMPFIPSGLGILWNSCNLPNINNWPLVNIDHLLLNFLHPGPSWILILPAAFGAGTSGNLDPKWCFFLEPLNHPLPACFQQKVKYIYRVYATNRRKWSNIQRSNHILVHPEDLYNLTTIQHQVQPLQIKHQCAEQLAFKVLLVWALWGFTPSPLVGRPDGNETFLRIVGKGSHVPLQQPTLTALAAA